MCNWKVNRHEWQTKCGEISYADWTDEGWKFCPFCGQPIEDATEYEHFPHEPRISFRLIRRFHACK